MLVLNTKKQNKIYTGRIHGWPDAAKVDPEDSEYQHGMINRIIRWRSSETHKITVQTGMKSFFFGQVKPMALAELSDHNFSFWMARFKNEFDPKGLAAPGQPHITDIMYREQYPDAITDEMKEIIAKVDAGSWMGNPP